MTAGERLRQLAGVSGTAAVLLLIIGTGATAGAVLVNYSGLSTGMASQHILVDRVAVSVAYRVAVSVASGGGSSRRRRRRRRILDEEELKKLLEALRQKDRRNQARNDLSSVPEIAPFRRATALRRSEELLLLAA